MAASVEDVVEGIVVVDAAAVVVVAVVASSPRRTYTLVPISGTSWTSDGAVPMMQYTFSHCESASVHLRSADCIGVVSWDTTPAKVASYRHSAPL